MRKTNGIRLAGALLAIAICFAIASEPARSQMQQSNGGGSAISTFLGLTTAGQQTMANSVPVVIASNQGAVPTSLASLPALAAGTSLIGYTRPQNGCGTTNYEAGLQMMPSALTSLTATTTCVDYIVFNNTTSSSVTITAVQDQTTNCNSAPCAMVSSFVLPGNSQTELPLHGSKFTSGIKWQAGTANAVVANVIGNQ